MDLINRGNIKEYCDILIYKRGVQYYKGDYVLNINREALEEKKSCITSMVASASSYNEYLTKFKIVHKNLDIEDFKCTCDYFKDKGKVCKHIVAAYLKIVNDFDFNKKDVQQFNLENLLEIYKKPLIIAEKQKKILKLEIILNNSSTEEIQNYVYLKVGLEKPYIVKNMKEFLQTIYFKNSLEFGKNFILDFKKYKFSEEDNKVLDFLVEILEMEESISSNYSLITGSRKLVKGRYIYLLDPQFKRFLRLINHKEFSLNLPIGEYENVKFNEDENIDFSVEKQGSKICLYHKNNNVPFPLTRDMEYFFYNGNICTLNEEKKIFYIPLYKTMVENSGCKLEIKEENKIDFASFIVPKIKFIGEIEIKSGLEDEFYKEDLKVKLFLDKEKDKIYLQVRFNYGDLEINPCINENIKNNKGILIRNIEKEIKVLKQINFLHFKQEDGRYVLGNENDVVGFMVDGIKSFPEEWEIFYSESFKNVKIYNSSNYKCSLRLNKEDMLEFSFDIKGIDRDELVNIFTALHQKRRYYKLSKGDIVLLNEKILKTISDILGYLDISPEEYTKEVIKLSKFNAFYIEQKLNNQDAYVSKNKELADLIYNFKEVKESNYEISKELKNILRPYQVVGFKWFKTLAAYGFGGILADEMGLGKTLQTIAFLASEKEKGTAIIVCPTSLVYNWQEEIKRFYPKFNILVLDGPKDEREEKVRTIKNYDIVITSYPLVKRDIELYKDFIFSYCIIDEAQQIKNPASQNALKVKEIKAKGKFALTGTPIENNLTELWSIFDFIMPSYFLTHNKFYSKYEVPISKDKNKETVIELRNKIQPFILRRLKCDVIKELPSKIYNNVLVKMGEEQKKLYASYVSVVKNELEEELKLKGINENKFKILGALTRLRQICCDPSVFLENYKGDSGKIEYLKELLESMIEEGHRILLFSQFTSVLKKIAEELKILNIRYFYLDGTVKSNERIKLVNKFNKGDAEVFLISLKAGGAGLNLTGADVVIHFDPWWNPAVEEQATDRAHRIGQKNAVQVIKMISKGTIEEKIQKLQDKKRAIVNEIMENDNLSENLLGNMTSEELLELFSY